MEIAINKTKLEQTSDGDLESYALAIGRFFFLFWGFLKTRLSHSAAGGQILTLDSIAYLNTQPTPILKSPNCQ